MPEENNLNKAINTEDQKWYHKTVKELFDEFKEFLDDLVDLREGMDQRGTIQYIVNNKRMRGANAWLLMCSIMVASLGLNLNSPAVIIGAMLISPLMSPILGIGLGFGINDKETMLTSFKHFLISIIIALVTSYIYFKITPLAELTHEISSRTAPNLLDGLVAIFGGVAGIISTTRKDKSNAIPGVAIATALMPPLCVAGYGLAEREFQFFLNAFYLFFLNSFFIALSTYLVIRLLRFRYKEFPNPKERRRNTIVMVVFSFIILLPAILLLINAYNDLQERKQIESYIKKQFEDTDTRISDWHTRKTDSVFYLDVQLIGIPVRQDKVEALDNELDNLLNKEVKLTTYQSREIPFDEIQRLKKEVGGFQEGLAEQVDKLRELQENRELKILELTKELDSLQNKVILSQIFEQAKIHYPDIEEIGFSKHFHQKAFSSQQDSIEVVLDIPILTLRWDRKKTRSSRQTDEAKLKKAIKQQIKLDTLILLAY